MPTKDGFTPDHPLPLFLVEHAEEPEQPGIGKAWDRAVISSRILKTSIFFATVTASLVDISALQPGTGQSTRDEIAAASEPADKSQTEIPQPSAEALFKQFQAWAAEEDARAPIEPVQPAQDARTQIGSIQPAQDDQAKVVQNAPAEVRPMQKHRHVQRVQNARAEIRPEQNPRAKVRREQNARAQIRPAQDPRAQDQSVQNAQAPSFLQSLGWRN